MSEFDSITSDLELIRSKRKTLALQIADDGHLIVRAPLRMSEKEIKSFIEKSQKWIETHSAKIKQTNDEFQKLEPFSIQDIEEMAQTALEVIPERVKFYSAKLGVTYGRITIRNQKTK